MLLSVRELNLKENDDDDDDDVDDGGGGDDVSSCHTWQFTILTINHNLYSVLQSFIPGLRFGSLTNSSHHKHFSGYRTNSTDCMHLTFCSASEFVILFAWCVRLSRLLDGF